jgi:TRAP-type mannitol/chloroaromatic compound transport system permease small subunit
VDRSRVPVEGGWLGRFARAVDALSTWAGTTSAWLYPVLVAVLIVNVGMRYGLSRGSIELEELQWHLFAAAFLLGIAYTYSADGHVRVDLLRNRWSARKRAWVELVGSLLLLFPFSTLLAYHAWGFFWLSWTLGERSAMPGGLPGRWGIKGVLFVALVLLSLQALASAAHSLQRIRRS